MMPNNKRMIVGLTGGIGSGKSAILAYLKEKYKAEIIETDRLAEGLMQPNEPVFSEVVQIFSNAILDSNGNIDRTKLAGIVFADKSQLQKLNAIVHPAVKTAILAKIEKSTAKIIVVESALLVEEHYDEICDELWYVRVSAENRIERLMASRGYTKEKCLSIMSDQLSDAEFLFACDRVIFNDGNLSETQKQVDEIVEEYEFL